MSILTHDEILKEIDQGNIKIDPYDPTAVGPASIDLRLSKYFRLFNEVGSIIDAKDDLDYQDHTELVERSQILLAPQQTILGVTEERVTLSDGLCGWLEGRSRFARIGIMVHISASFMQPGISNHQVLEISNMGPSSVYLYAGTRICQFIFQRTEGRATYSGRFVNQVKP